MRLLALWSAAVLMVVAAGCGQEPEKPKPPEVRTFVLITNMASGDVQQGAEAAAKAAEKKYPNSSTVVQIKAAVTAADQVRELDAAIAAGADGVGIDCIAVPEVSAAIARCVQAGIPAVTYNNDCPGTSRTGTETAAEQAADPGRHTFVGASLAEIGKILGYQVQYGMDAPRGVVAVVSGPETPALSAIEASLRSYLADLPEVTLRQPVRPDLDPGAVTEAIKSELQQEDNIRGWIILNPAAVPDAAAMPLEGLGSAEVVMLGGFEDRAMDAVGPEKVDVLVAVPFMQYGSAVVQILNGITRERRNYPHEVPILPTIVKIDNLEKIKALRDKMRSGEITATVVPAGGVKPNQPKPEESAEPAPTEPPAMPETTTEEQPAEAPAEGAGETE